MKTEDDKPQAQAAARIEDAVGGGHTIEGEVKDRAKS